MKKNNGNKNGNNEIKISEKGTMYRECQLFPHAVKGKRDASKPWIISYYVYNVTENKLERKLLKKYNNIKDAKERELLCNALMFRINELLKNGYVFNPENIENTNQNLSENQPKMGALLKDFLAHKKAQNMADSSLIYLTHILKIVDKFLVIHNLESLNPLHFSLQIKNKFIKFLSVEYLYQGRNLSAHYQKKVVEKLSTFFEWYRINYKPDFVNPMNQVKIKTAETDRNTPLTKKQIELIFAAMEQNKDYQMLLFANMMFYTFLRPHQEIRLLTVGQIKENHIVVYGSKTKNDKNKLVAIPRALNELIDKLEIRNLPKDRWLFIGRMKTPPCRHYFYLRFRKYLAEYGEPGQTLYSLKASGNIALYEKYGDLNLNKKQNGHQSEKTTMHYIKKHSPAIDERLLDF